MSAANPTGGGAGGSQLTLNPADAEAIAACHDSASARITSQAGSVPTVDGGDGTADLNLIFAKVLGTADDLALVNEAAAEQVRQVSSLLTSTDAEVAAAFGHMAGTSWPYGEAGAPAGLPGGQPGNPFTSDPGSAFGAGGPWSTQ